MTDEEYDAEAQAAWNESPKQAMIKYGLPCWHGHFGGCRAKDTCERTANIG